MGAAHLCRSPNCVLFGGYLLTVTYVKEAASKGYIKVGVGDGEEKCAYVLSVAQYKELGELCRGDFLTREALSLLTHYDSLYRARLKAMRILSFGDNSVRTLVYKLKRAGFTTDVACEVAEEMLSLGYINTTRQLERLITSAVNLHNLGKRKIIPKLIAKGYDRADIEKTIDKLLLSGEIDFSLARERLIAKLAENHTEEDAKKILYKNGHSVCSEDL